MKTIKLFIPMLIVIFSYLSCQLFPKSPFSYDEVPVLRLNSNSLWYQPIPASPAIDGDSEAIIEKMRSLVEDDEVYFGLSPEDWEPSIYYTASETELVSVRLMSRWSSFNGVKVPIPDYAMPDPQADSHLCIIDSNRGLEWDFWNVRRLKGSWVASTVGIIDYANDEDGFHERGGCRATRVALTAGVIWPQELLATNIQHALIFSYPYNRAGGPVHPANGSDGWAHDSAAMPEGAHIQLDPSLDLDSLDLDPYQKAIARALQQYGAYNVDNGGSFVFYTVGINSFSENPYEQIPSYNDWGAIPLDAIPIDSFRVLEMGEQYEPDFSDVEIPHQEYYY